MNNELVLDTRELSEIKHCLLYANECGHGTVGHNLLNLVAKLASARGFTLNYVGASEEHSGYVGLDVPEGVNVAAPPSPGK
jgi:hypothetical protein